MLPSGAVTGKDPADPVDTMARFSRHAEALERTKQEIVQERAAALKRIAEGLEARLESLEALRNRVARASDGERPERVREFNELRRDARHWLWYLEVQREANGLRDHAPVHEHYEIPPPL